LKKYPAVFTAIPLAAGIILGRLLAIHFLFSNYFIYLFVQIILILVAVILYIKYNKTSYIYYFPYFLLTAIFAFNSFQYRYLVINEKSIESYINKTGENGVKLFGKIIEQPDIREDRIRLIISADSVSISGNIFFSEGNVIATVYRNHFLESEPQVMRYGDDLCITGKLESLPHKHNPGEFDYGEYLKLHGINAAFTAFGYDKINLNGSSESGLYKRYVIYPVKSYAVAMIDSLIGGDEGEFMKGLVLGDRSNISNEIKENFVKAGVSHIIAVSGLNVAYVMIVINGLLLIFPIKRSYKTFIVILFLVFYMNLTGNSPSIVRATIMAIVFLLSQLIERRPLSYNIVAFSAVVIFLIDPAQLFDAGFILSFGAILSIIIFYRPLNNMMFKFKWYSMLSPDNKANKLLKASVQLILGTLAAQIGTLPIIAIMFNRISIISLFTNLIAIPVSNIALAIGFLVVILSTFSLWLAGIFAQTASFLLFILLKFIDYFANLDFSFVEVYRVRAFSLLFYYAMLILFFIAAKRNYKVAVSLVILLTANFLLYRSIFEQKNTAILTYLDVGKSDACLITAPEGANILVNSGGSTQKYNSAQRNVIPYMKMSGVKNLDYLILTSLDKDEFRNLFYLLKDFTVAKVYVPVYYRSLFEEEHFKRFFSDKNIEFVSGSKMIAGRDYRIYMYYDNRIIPASSMLVRFTYGNTSFAFADSKDMREDFIYSVVFKDGDSVNVLKVPASGSFNQTSPEFIVRADPIYAVIASSNAKKKLQSEIFSRSLGLYGINVLNTGENGANIFESNGEKCVPVDWK
jgi:competence protein ComEC